MAPRWSQLARSIPERVHVRLYIGTSRAERPAGEQLASQTLLYSHSLVYPTQVNRDQGSIWAFGGSPRVTRICVVSEGAQLSFSAECGSPACSWGTGPLVFTAFVFQPETKGLLAGLPQEDCSELAHYLELGLYLPFSIHTQSLLPSPSQVLNLQECHGLI